MKILAVPLLAALLGLACDSKRNPAPTAPNIMPIAKASANVQSGAAPLIVKFSSSGSSDPDGKIIAWAWDFGDGSGTSLLQFPSHTYVNAGSYVASLTVVDNMNGAGLDTLHITVF